MIGVAVIGVGGWGASHLRVLGSPWGARSGASLRWVSDHDPGALRDALVVAGPLVRATERYAEVLAAPEVDAVVIVTDAKTHHTIARDALLAGKHVLVEKPLALSDAHARELCDLADERRLVLSVGHLLLHHPAVVALKAMVDAGELGELLYLHAQRLNLGVVRRDENVLWSLASHDVSLANHLLGAVPVEVSAAGASFLQVERGIEDVAFATLRYADRRVAHVHVSWLDPHKTRRLTVVGNKKMAVFDDTSPDMKLVLFDKGAEPPPPTLSYEEGVRIRTGDVRVPAVRMEEPLRLQLSAFVRAIETGAPTPSSGRAGRDVVRVLEAASRSLREHGRPIAVEA
jgi:predicted dehydrogenase